MYNLTNPRTGVTVTLTESEVDAIYSAMRDYIDYGDAEAEIACNVEFKLSTLGEDVA